MSIANLGSVDMVDLPIGLSLEQKFNLKMYEDQVKGLSQEQAQSFVLELMRQMMVKENVIKHLMKQS
jgi:hypothetical protein